ncbi:MAG: hypothetical protein ACXACF_07570 [Candidatus Hermodarchaeia archaeon]
MPNPKRSTIILLGLLISVALAIIVYFTQWQVLYSLVYTTYFGFTNPLQLYELAWILATIDYLLNFSILNSLLLWIAVTIIVALLIRNVNATLTTLTVAILLLSGIWLLFSIKYAFVVDFSISFLFDRLLLLFQPLWTFSVLIVVRSIAPNPSSVYIVVRKV